MKIILTYIFFLLVFALLGFSREFIFVHMNDRLYSLYYGHQDSVLPNSLEFLKNFDYSTIYYSKYFLTLTYYLAYLIVTYQSIRKICYEKALAKFSIYIYLLILIISFIIFILSYILHNQINEAEYTLIRWLMGIAQSPLIAFFMIASFSLYKKMVATKSTT